MRLPGGFRSGGFRLREMLARGRAESCIIFFSKTNTGFFPMTMNHITSASLKNLSERLVEMGLLPNGAGDVALESLNAGLVRSIRKVRTGALMIVSESRIPQLTKRFLRVETREKDKIAVTYVLACNNQ